MSLTPEDSGSQPLAATELKRELKVADAAAFSIGLIGPVGVMALLGAGAAGILGAGAVWAFVFALVAIGLVAYGFVKLSRHISHTGSVYATVGLTLGPRTGFIAGFTLFFAYITIGAGSGMEIGLFVNQLFKDLGWNFQSDWVWISLIALALVLLLGRREVRIITRVLLYAELVGAVLVTILNIIVLIKLAVGAGPHGLGLNWGFLALPSNTNVSLIAAAAVFGFLAFAGFEGAATLGEESRNPKRDIPRAFKIAIILVGAFYLLSTSVQSLGYGTDAAGSKKFAGSAAPYGDLARAFVGPWLADILTLMATISLFAIFLGTLSGAARVGLALSRDTGLVKPMSRVSKSGAPITAITVSVIGAAIVIVGERFTGAAVLDATFWSLTVGTIALLVAYVLATVGAAKFLFFRSTTGTPKWQIIVPILALVLVLYTIYTNTVGLAPPYSFFPYIVLAWLVIGFLISLRRGLTDRVRAALHQSGIGDAAADGTEREPVPTVGE